MSMLANSPRPGGQGRITGWLAARHPGQPAALAALMMVLFLTFLDNTVVSVALGSVQSELHAGVTFLQWVVSAYALTFAGAMLAFGMVGDEFGRKRVMLIGVAIFCAGSVLSALAPNIQVLIAGRAVMGFGAAASEPGTLSMLRHLYPDERARARAVGVWTAVCGLALALGPVIGGVLVGVWNWRAIFWFNLVFGAAALVAGALALPENADPDAHRVDIPGFAFGAAALSALIFGVISAETAGFAAPSVIALLCVSAVAGAAFVFWERRAAHPLLDLRYLRVPRFLTANVVAFAAYFATFAIFFFTALYLAEVVGYSGYQIALVFLPLTVLMTASALLAGRWEDTAAPRWSIAAGCAVFGAGLLLTALVISPSPNYAELAATLALTGIGIGATRTLRDGRLGHQHQPRDRRRPRRRGPRHAGQLAAERQPDRQAAGAGHPGQLPVDRDQRDRDRQRAVKPQRQRRRACRRQQDRARSHPRRLQRVLLGPARRAVPGRRARVRGRPVHAGHVRPSRPVADDREAVTEIDPAGSPDRRSIPRPRSRPGRSRPTRSRAQGGPGRPGESPPRSASWSRPSRKRPVRSC